MQRLKKWFFINREYLIVVMLLFVIGINIGFTAHSSRLDAVMATALRNVKSIAQIYVSTGSKHWVLALLIFKNNLYVALLSFILGTFLSIYPVLITLTNGITIGYVLTHSSYAKGISIWEMCIIGILPHGIFEIPAFIISAAMGIKLGSIWIRPISGKNRLNSYLHVCKEGLRMGPVVVGLLLIAASVEGFITPVLIHSVVG